VHLILPVLVQTALSQERPLSSKELTPKQPPTVSELLYVFSTQLRTVFPQGNSCPSLTPPPLPSLQAQQRKNNPLLSPAVAQAALRQQQLQAAIQRAGGYTQFMKQYERQAAETHPQRSRRGVDERTFKAQEEIRRKAQARGVGANRAEPGKMSFEELLSLISAGGHNLKHQGGPPAGGVPKGPAGKKTGGPTGLGALGAAAGLGVGLGGGVSSGGSAGSSAPSTPKPGKEPAKKSGESVPASPVANGGAAAPPQAPQGLGGGLDLPGKGKGKAKAKKSKA
jgi:hypothetical protein